MAAVIVQIDEDLLFDIEEPPVGKRCVAPMIVLDRLVADLAIILGGPVGADDDDVVAPVLRPELVKDGL